MNIFGWIVVGLIAGALASRVTGHERQGCIYTIVVGVLGALLGGAIAQAAGEEGLGDFSWRSLIIAFLGACLLLLVLQAISGRRDTPNGFGPPRRALTASTNQHTGIAIENRQNNRSLARKSSSRCLPSTAEAE